MVTLDTNVETYNNEQNVEKTVMVSLHYFRVVDSSCLIILIYSVTTNC